MIIFRISKNIWKMVSIPTTVSGGLQFVFGKTSSVVSFAEFQYRQRYQEGYNHTLLRMKTIEGKSCFNTDNGIRRATINLTCR